MRRTTIMLDPELKDRAERFARKHGMSLGGLIREALSRRIEVEPRGRGEDDPFFSDTRVFSGPTPHDLAEDHDRYLYGDEP